MLCHKMPQFWSDLQRLGKAASWELLGKYFENIFLPSFTHTPTRVSGWGNKGTLDATSVTVEGKAHKGRLAYGGAHTPLPCWTFLPQTWQHFHILSPNAYSGSYH